MKRILLSAAILICGVWLALCGCTAQISTEQKSFSAPEFPYTFVRTQQTERGEVTFYESGDRIRRYYHDQTGRVLVRNQGGVFYAKNEDGKAVSSGIAYPTTEKAANAVAMSASEIIWEKNPEWVDENNAEDSVSNDALLGTDFKGTIVNLVIFIAFSDDQDTIDEGKVESLFHGGGDSLSDYFNVVSNGNIQIKNLIPRENTRFFVYRAPNPRRYYNVTNGSLNQQTRGKKEAELLTGAVQAAKSRLQTVGLNLDVNRDGYLDAVSFLVGGASSGDWGNLLWPHSWNLTLINNSYNNGAAAEIGGVKVGDYSFNFLDGLSTGVLCHEFFHVLGAPDLYHYAYDFVPVGDWDLMQFNHTTPQYPLAYMRETYLNGALGDSIGTVRHNGVYTLKPVTVAGREDTVAYKIPTERAGEYFMVEYRTPTRALTYDKTLPSSGLIVYRVKEGVKDGNRNAKYQNQYYPDEVYVFRPRVASTGLETKDTVRYANSKEDLKYAALSPANPYFSSVGTLLNSGVASALYDYETLYYTNGRNSGIVIETLAMDKDSITFSVRFSGGNTIDDTYFRDKITLSEGQFVNDDHFSGVQAEVTFAEIDTSYLGGLELKLYDDNDTLLATAALSQGEFVDRYGKGERTFPVKFIVNDKGNTMSGVFAGGVLRAFSRPTRITATVTDADGDSVEVAAVAMGNSSWSWDTILATRVEPTASISAGNRLTVGVGTDGTVAVSGNRNAGQWAVSRFQNAVQASAGYTHTLVRTKDLKVSAAGTDEYGETAVAHWQNIREIAAGYYVSYGVTLDGGVLFAGHDAYGLSAATEWQEIVKISPGKFHVVGLTSDGRAVSAGNNASGQCNVPKRDNITDIAAGRTFSAFLYADGTVEVCGNFSGMQTVKEWKNIKMIAAGDHHLVGLTSEGRVLSAGDDGYGQCDTEQFYDIIAVSASEYHTAVLRIDGKVEIAGSSPGFSLDIARNLMYDGNAYISVERISLRTERSMVYVGEEIALEVDFYPVMSTYTRAIFTSDRPDIASVHPLTGKVTAKAEGRAILRATDKGTGLESSIVLDVYVLKDAERVLFAEKQIILSAGQSLIQTLIYEPGDATRFGDLKVEVLDGTEQLSANLYQPQGSLYRQVLFSAGQQTGSYTVRLTYSAPSGTFTDVATVQVVSGITSIRLLEKGRTEYRYGEPLEDGGLLEVAYDDGQTATVHVNAAMLSYDSVYMVGSNRVLVTYMDQVTAYHITVYDWVDYLCFSQSAPPIITYIYGGEPDFSVGEIDLHYIGGTPMRTGIPLSEATVTGFRSTSIGKQTLTVSYDLTDPIDGKTYTVFGNYTVTVEDTVIRIASALVKKEYNFGQPISPEDLFTVEMASGQVKTLEISEGEVSGFDSTILGTQTIKIGYVDPATGRKYETADTVKVTLSGSLQIVGGDGGFELMDENVYWYEIGKNLRIFVLILFGDGSSAEAEPKETRSGNLWYELEGFSTDKEGAGQAFIKVFGRKMTDSVVEDILLYDRIAIDTYGRSAIIRAYLEGDSAIRYGETPKISLVVEEAGGTTLRTDTVELEFDPELVDIEQIVRVRFMNEYVTGFLTIYDYGVGLRIEGTDAVYFGETPTFRVELMTAAGKARYLSESEYEWSYDVTDLHGTLRVKYEELNITKNYDVRDILTDMSVAENLKIYYLYGEPLVTDYTVKLHFLSGAAKRLPFISDEFRLTTDYVSTVTGRYTVTLRYPAYERELQYTVFLEDYVERLVLDAPTEILYGNPFRCEIFAVYASGKRESIALNRVQYHFDSESVGRQEVTVKYTYALGGGTKTAEENLVVYVTDEVLSAVLVKEPTQKEYRYGEAFLFLDGKIRVTYRSGKTAEYDGRSLDLFDVTYYPTRVGVQTVTLSVGGKSVELSVSVRAKTEQTLRLGFPDGVRCDQKNGVIVSDTPMSYDMIASYILPADYLSVVTPNEIADGYFPTGGKIEIVNENGMAVFRFRYVLKGDADANGVFDEKDLQTLIDGYVQGALDINVGATGEEKEVTLTDIVKWTKKARSPKQQPVNAVGRNFIKAIRKEEQVYEEREI